jgi:hypothetical protein
MKRKSTTKNANYKRMKFRSELFISGLSTEQMAKRLKTNGHNVRIFISRNRKKRPDLFPYKNPNNWLVNKNK